MSEQPVAAGIVHVPDQPSAHTCTKPDIWSFGPIVDGVPSVEYHHREGTVWQCSCGVGHVVTWQPAERIGSLIRAPGWVWRRETRHQRRKRSGLRWWQREVSRG